MPVPVSLSFSVRAKILLVLWPIGFAGLASYYLATTDSLYYTGLAVLFLVVIASTELIYEDAKAVNKAKGRKVLDATLWSLVTFVLWEVSIPLYLFSRRKSALVS